MATKLQQIWQVLNTDIRELGQPGEVAEAGAEVSKAVLELAIAIGWLSAIPSAPVAAAGLSFVGIARQGVNLFRDKAHKEPILEELVAIVFPLAYLESFNKLVQSNDLLRQIGEIPVSDLVKQQVEKLGQFLLDEQLAKNALICFHESELAQALNQVLLNQLQQVGIAQNQAQILTAWVAWDTQRCMKSALRGTKNTASHLIALYDSVQQAQSKYDSINNYLKREIAEQPNKSVFNEIFTFKDIYVPLKAQVVNNSSQICNDAEPFEIQSWAKNMLQDSSKQGQMIFIQGKPGRGKSVFCLMFADLVWQHFHPLWTPILIRLRNIPKLQESFQATLREAVNQDFASSDPGWLTDRDTRFLFLLDGFDELVMQGRASGGLREFLQQVEQFQRDCHRNPEMGHRVLITGRPLALYGLERFMPNNLERVELLPMDNELQQKWFAKWEKQIELDKALKFQQFLQDSRCPYQIQELAREPLLLYLLAAMHRDGELSVEMFEAATYVNAKIRIYEKSLDWVLTKQRSDSDHPDLNWQLTSLETEDLKQILSEAALCVVQSGGECASVEMVAARLKDDLAARAFLQQAPQQSGDKGLTNALSVFYLEQSSQKGSVEFTHKSFSEFLCARWLKESLEDWTQPGKKGKGFNIQAGHMDWEIYDLLGYGGLTPEIVEYLMALLDVSDEFRPEQLFERLEDFYLRWCKGEFIDTSTETLPQKKSRELADQRIQRGQRHVDIYTGLNVLILLLELHRYAQQRDDLKDKIAFYPCGQFEEEGFEPYRLINIINYSDCLYLGNFTNTVGRFLPRANLCGVVLINAVLSSADLNGADLRHANLVGAYFVEADLSSANLSSVDLDGARLQRVKLVDANLGGADLSNANLSGANLSGVNLSGTNLINANLSDVYLGGTDFGDEFLNSANFSGANLCGANLSRADLGDEFFGVTFANILWNKYTRWEDIRGWDTAVNIPEDLKQQLGLAR